MLRLVVLFALVSSCLAVYTSPPDFRTLNLTYPNGTGTKTWRTACYLGSQISNISITGGFSAIATVSFDNNYHANFTLQLFLGPSCASTPATTLYGFATCNGTDASNGSYTKFRFQVNDVQILFNNSIVLAQFNAAFVTASNPCNANPQLYALTDLGVTQNCGSFYIACPTRYIALTSDASGLRVSSFISQTNTGGCSDATALTDYSSIPAFTELTDLLVPTVNITLQSTNAQPGYAKTNDQVFAIVTANKVLKAAPTISLGGTIATSVNCNSNYTVCNASFVVLSTFVQSDLCLSVVAQSYSDLAGNQGSAVTGCANGQTLYYLKYAPSVSYASYNVGNTITPTYVDAFTVVNFRAQAPGGNYANSIVTLNFSDGTNVTIPYSFLDGSGVANYVYTIKQNDPTGPTKFIVSGITDSAGNSASLAATTAPIIVASYPRLYLAALDATSKTSLSGSFYCVPPTGATIPSTYTPMVYIGIAPNIYYDIGVAPYTSYDLARNYTFVNGTGQQFAMNSNLPNKQGVPCPAPGSNPSTAVLLSSSFYNTSTWYTVAYVTYYSLPSGSAQYSPQVAIAGSVFSTTGSSCFPGDSSVLLENGMRKPIRSLSVGDRVLSATDSAHSEFSDIVAIHVHSERTVFMHIEYESDGVQGSLRITPGHLLFKADSALDEPVLAETLRVGDSIRLWSGKSAFSTAQIAFISFVADEAAFSPVTMNGRLVVDQVLVSSYGRNGATLGHLAHSFHRMLYRIHPALAQSSLARSVENFAVYAWHAVTKASAFSQ